MRQLSMMVCALACSAAPTPTPERNVSIEMPAPVAPRLSGISVGTVTAFEIRRPDLPTVRIARRGDGFVIEAPVTETASTTLVNRALRRLQTMSSTRVVTNDAARHHVLRVDSTRVVVHAGAQVVLDIYMAPYHNEFTKVRVAGSDTVFAVAEATSFPFLRPLRYWRRREIVEVDAATMSELTLGHEQEIRMARDPDGWTCVDGCDSQPGSRLDADGMDDVANRAAHMLAYDVASPSDTQGVSFDGFWVRVRSGQEVIEVEFSEPRRDGSYLAQRRGEPTVYIMSKLSTEDLMLTRSCCSGRVDIMAQDTPPDLLRGAPLEQLLGEEALRAAGQ